MHEQLTVLTIPKLVPQQSARATQENIPAERAEREALRRHVAAYVAEHREELTPPLLNTELRRRAEDATRAAGLDAKFSDYVGVLLNNEVWREHLASTPFERRLLLLPKCLRVEDRCPAPFDEFGLLCKQCGLCTIQDLQEEAEKLGYAVLVAEGSALVMALIQTGKIDAIVGVSCLSVLEKAFPHMENAAIPGIAIPLLQDDCKDTAVDVEWVWDYIHLTSDDRTRRLDLDALHRKVDEWFAPAALDEVFGGVAESDADQLARTMLAQAGKRWRPFLTLCAYQALQSDPHAEPPAALRKAAIAVECFHKASLIHDDIEDEDDLRYGEPTLHASHGVATAINVGDLLVGEGYRLLAECDFEPAVRAELVRIASLGHRTLCLGQGAELAWMREPRPLTAQEVLAIFQRKTAPAFAVSLEIGAACAGADQRVFEVLRKYSDALGVAYQIRDDLDDLESGADGVDDLAALRPSLPLAVAYEQARREPVSRAALEAAWRRTPSPAAREALEQSGAAERCRQLLESYKEEAVRSIADLDHASLKGLLRRVVGKIFSVEIEGWCGEFETRNAAGREAGAEVAR
ncbi:MAG: polyprenyl synthetase family protein [Bryobacterales bacterium]|nr:polyprenyl synthetase family protein [Bryobacterales bacterium]